MFLFWRAVNLQMNRTVKYQGAFSRIEGFAGKRFLFSPLPLPLQPFFCFHSNFRAITRLETLATQAINIVEFWEYCLNKRLARASFFFIYIRVFLSLSMLCVIVGEDSLLWRFRHTFTHARKSQWLCPTSTKSDFRNLLHANLRNGPFNFWGGGGQFHSVKVPHEQHHVVCTQERMI